MIDAIQQGEIKYVESARNANMPFLFAHVYTTLTTHVGTHPRPLDVLMLLLSSPSLLSSSLLGSTLTGTGTMMLVAGLTDVIGGTYRQFE